MPMDTTAGIGQNTGRSIRADGSRVMKKSNKWNWNQKRAKLGRQSNDDMKQQRETTWILSRLVIDNWLCMTFCKLKQFNN